MPAYAVIGAQWGDEGKGKIIDVLAENAAIIARYSGGNNAGHTVMNDAGTFKLHLVPSGICWPHAMNVIGNGVVVDPDVLLKEIQENKLDPDHLAVSDRAHLIMPSKPFTLAEYLPATPSNQPTRRALPVVVPYSEFGFERSPLKLSATSPLISVGNGPAPTRVQ